jgi:transaldolase / glucose-6-phosphate isomerase
MAERVPDLEALRDEARGDADRVLVIDAGSTARSPWAFAGAFAPVEGFPRLDAIESTEPSAVAAAAEHDPARTLYVVASRTGAALETNLIFDLLYERARERLGEGGAGRRFLAVTEEGSALATEAAKRRVRAIVAADPRTPADFAPLSPFGLLPAALVGLPIQEVLARASRMAEACRAPGAENPGLLLGAALAAEALDGRDKLTISVPDALSGLGTWIEGLVGAATGKDGKGLVPIGGEPLGGPEVYGSDRVFARIDLADAPDTQADHRLATLVEHGHPLMGFVLQEPADLGAEIFRWEFAAAVAGKMLSVNPFDEPDLADARNRTSRILAGAAPERSVAEAQRKDAAQAIASIRPGDYFAVSAFLPDRPAIAEAIARLRLAVRAARRVATVGGFAPRIQHVAGQIQKGGPNRGVFLQLLGPAEPPLPIPGRPWGFETVFEAQADADLEALAARGRRVARVRVDGDAEKAIGRLAEAAARERAVGV